MGTIIITIIPTAMLMVTATGRTIITTITITATPITPTITTMIMFIITRTTMRAITMSMARPACSIAAPTRPGSASPG